MSKDLISLEESDRQRREYERNVFTHQVNSAIQSTLERLNGESEDEKAVQFTALGYGKKVRKLEEMGLRGTKEKVDMVRAKWFTFLSTLGIELRSKAVVAYWAAYSEREE